MKTLYFTEECQLRPTDKSWNSYTRQDIMIGIKTLGEELMGNWRLHNDKVTPHRLFWGHKEKNRKFIVEAVSAQTLWWNLTYQWRVNQCTRSLRVCSTHWWTLTYQWRVNQCERSLRVCSTHWWTLTYQWCVNQCTKSCVFYSQCLTGI